jgi:hypothetical protein
LKPPNPESGPKMRSLLCALLLFWFGAGCNVGGDGGSPAVITVESNDVLLPPKSDPRDSQEVTLAKCLSSKGAVLYGASWCPYTQKQIASFKDGFQNLSYVECTKQGTLCRERGVSAYPTWIIGESRIVGYRAPAEIGSAAGCSW